MKISKLFEHPVTRSSQISLADQIHDILCEEIHNGRWQVDAQMLVCKPDQFVFPLGDNLMYDWIFVVDNVFWHTCVCVCILRYLTE